MRTGFSGAAVGTFDICDRISIQKLANGLAGKQIIAGIQGNPLGWCQCERGVFPRSGLTIGCKLWGSNRLQRDSRDPHAVGVEVPRRDAPREYWRYEHTRTTGVAGRP